MECAIYLKWNFLFGLGWNIFEIHCFFFFRMSDKSIHLWHLQGPEQIHGSKFFKDVKNGLFIKYISNNARTLYETFRRGSYESNNGPCLGWRDRITSPYQVIGLMKAYFMDISQARNCLYKLTGRYAWENQLIGGDGRP